MQNTPDILRKILQHKVQEVIQRSQQRALRDVAASIEQLPAPRGFVQAIETHLAAQRPAVIAEIKKASPSKGLIREDFDPVRIAKAYQDAGASCISVLTDEAFFQGHDNYLQDVQKACQLPLLRKDFIVDAYQIYEARAMQADCILLIVAALGDAQLMEFVGLAEHLELDVLIEVHNEEELERALQLPSGLLGINNRNLRTFETRLENTLQLLDKVPDNRIVVTESAIHTKEDVALMQRYGVNSFLVGEAFMRAKEPGEALKALFF